ncbi:MAG: zinc-dependent alcohol dehydrogenase family protein [Micropepsaceae bacterium]
MSQSYRAMRLEKPGTVLREADLKLRGPRENEVRIRVNACAVCRTDLHLVDGELANTKHPIVPGHEIIGHVEAVGAGVKAISEGTRVGVPWLGWTCGSCDACKRGQENLCPKARFTGCHIDGGFAEIAYADSRYVFPIPKSYSDSQAAPLMCAGLIGWRALKMAGNGKRLGLYGFGAAAHIAIQVARHRQQDVYAFVRPQDSEARDFARKMGAVWAGDSDARAPEELDAAIIFAPVGALIPQALRAVRPGGAVVCGGIHMSDIPSFPYRLLWEERSLCSVANLTRRDAEEFLALAPDIPVRCETVDYRLDQANAALDDLREGRFSGAAVLIP